MKKRRSVASGRRFVFPGGVLARCGRGSQPTAAWGSIRPPVHLAKTAAWLPRLTGAVVEIQIFPLGKPNARTKSFCGLSLKTHLDWALAYAYRGWHVKKTSPRQRRL
jgi:hypothetical protein